VEVVVHRVHEERGLVHGLPPQPHRLATTDHRASTEQETQIPRRQPPLRGISENPAVATGVVGEESGQAVAHACPHECEDVIGVAPFGLDTEPDLADLHVALDHHGPARECARDGGHTDPHSAKQHVRVFRERHEAGSVGHVFVL